MFDDVVGNNKQGNIGLAEAIAYFVRKGYTVSIPLNDTQSYDIIVDDGKKLIKISVKTSSYINRQNSYKICLGAVYRPLKDGISKRYHRFNQAMCDYVFILLSDGRKFLIPSPILHNKMDTTMSATADSKRNKYIKYEVK